MTKQRFHLPHFTITGKKYAHLEADQPTRLLIGLAENPVSQPEDVLMRFFQNISKHDLRRLR
jgi:hypothetical protein